MHQTQEKLTRPAAETYEITSLRLDALQVAVEVRLDIFRPFRQTRQFEGPQVDTGQQVVTEASAYAPFGLDKIFYAGNGQFEIILKIQRKHITSGHGGALVCRAFKRRKAVIRRPF